MIEIIVMVILCISILCLIEIAWEVRHPQITVVELDTDKLESDVCFAVISDLHNSVYGKENSILKGFLEEINPDAVLIPGDMIVGKKGHSTEKTQEFLSYIQKKYPVFYAPGNHEMRSKKEPQIYGVEGYSYVKDLSKYQNVVYLEDDMASFHEITIYGLDLESEYYKKGKKIALTKDAVEKHLGKVNQTGYSILLAHHPMYFDGYAKWGADLVLSGHNHGGIARIPFWRGVLTADLKLFHPYARGVHKKGNSTMVISRGLGTHTLPIRFLNRPELIQLIIHGKKRNIYGDRSNP